MDAGQRAGILAEAKAWRGTPFLHMGRTIKGTDCGGMIWALHEHRVKGWAPYPEWYPEDWALHVEHVDVLYKFLKPYFNAVTFPQAGDVVLFHFGRAYSHAAILTERKTYIHAWGRKGAVIEVHAGFWRLPNGKPRPRINLSVKDELWQS